jgi:hypothetical protein
MQTLYLTDVQNANVQNPNFRTNVQSSELLPNVQNDSLLDSALLKQSTEF